MKPLQILAVLGTLVISVVALSYVARLTPPIDFNQQKKTVDFQPPHEEHEDPDAPKDPEKDFYPKNPFTFSKAADQPEATLVEDVHKFGRMGLGKIGKHDFVLKNTGKAPLKIAKGPTQCKCTVSGLKDQEIPPGGEASIHLSWEPKNFGPFSQSSTVWTNDPKHPELKVIVEGDMFAELDVHPRDGWKFDTVTTSEPTPLEGVIESSIIEKFEITKIETSSDRVKLEAVPFTEAELKREGGSTELRSGYRLVGELAGITEPGKVEENIIVHTNLEDYPKFEFPVNATRVGALSIIGPNWFAGGPLIDIGKVDAAKGKEIKFTVMLPPGDEEFKLTEIHIDPGFVTARLEPAKTGKELARERYTLYLTVPPGSPTGVWASGNPGKVLFKTNHPIVPEIETKLHLDIQ
ncbi:DUF1573 domain-containing protein [Planctomicrobium sp. SH668]|uniref:DUF1573 domain-containing protein n=1 Tax=Planctomicrobium sp. SH668 TaxID=3448126 RepID=UPI003F5B5718